MIRARVRDGAHVMKHQLGKFMAADGLTKATTEALNVLVAFLHSNRMGAEGVEQQLLEPKVEEKLQRAFHAGKIHPHNVHENFIDALAQACHKEVTGQKVFPVYFNGQLPF